MNFEEYWNKEKQNIKFDGYIQTVNEDDYPNKIIFECIGCVNAEHLKILLKKPIILAKT